MKKLGILALIALTGCATEDQWPTMDALVLEPKTTLTEVVVLGRTWRVWQDRETPGRYNAIRDNNNLNPFGPPAALRTPQAVRAIELATGCKVNRPGMVQDITGRFYANVICT
jgi:hypothetical protein